MPRAVGFNLNPTWGSSEGRDSPKKHDRASIDDINPALSYGP